MWSSAQDDWNGTQRGAPGKVASAARGGAKTAYRQHPYQQYWSGAALPLTGLPWRAPVDNGSTRFKQPDTSNCPFWLWFLFVLFLFLSIGLFTILGTENQMVVLRFGYTPPIRIPCTTKVISRVISFWGFFPCIIFLTIPSPSGFFFLHCFVFPFSQKKKCFVVVTSSWTNGSFSTCLKWYVLIVFLFFLYRICQGSVADSRLGYISKFC